MPHRALPAAFLTGLALRLALVTFRNFGFPPGWGGEVVSVATALVNGRGFADLYNAATGPTAHLLPLYPTFLAFLFLVFGITPLAGYAAMWVNAVLSSAVVFPLYRLGERFFTPAVAQVAVWAWALWPLSGHTDAKWIWATSLLVLLVTGMLSLASSRRWVLRGILMGVGALTDTSAMVAAGVVFLYSLRFGDWRKACGSALISLVMIAPWIGRNIAVFHGQVFLRSNFGLELARGVAEDELADVRDPIRQPNRDRQEHEAYRRLGEAQYNRQKFLWAVSTIREDPASFAYRCVRRATAFWMGNREIDYLYWPAGRFLLLKHVFHLLPALFALGAAIWMAVQRRKESLLFLAMFVLFPAVYYIATASPRHRAPMEPIFLLLSAWLILRFREEFCSCPKADGAFAPRVSSTPLLYGRPMTLGAHLRRAAVPHERWVPRILLPPPLHPSGGQA